MMNNVLALILMGALIRAYPSATTLYTVGSATDQVYRVDINSGNVSTVLNSATTGASLRSIALLNNSTAYLLGASSSPRFYQVNLLTGTNTTATPPAGRSVALANATTAYTTATDNLVIRKDLTTGSVTTLTPSAISGASLISIATERSLTTPQVAYVLGNSNNLVYRVNLNNGSYSSIMPTPFPGGSANITIALMNNETAYVTAGTTNIVYRLNLTNGSYTAVNSTPLTGHNIRGIALADSNTAYISTTTTNLIYRMDLTTGNVSLITPSAITGAGLQGVALVLQIGTSQLAGNDLLFADYLNANGSYFTIPLFALQADIPSAVSSAAPTRNAIPTFAAQLTQMGLGKLVYDHLARKRWSHTAKNYIEIEEEQLAFNSGRLLAQVSETSSDTLPYCENQLHRSPWMGFLGQYIQENAQNQTPEFESSSGGGIAAMDFYRDTDFYPLFGMGASYAYTHVHETGGAGQANINQGSLVVYSSWMGPQWYGNLALSGGAYFSDNVRNIVLPAIANAQATSDTSAWLVTPHVELGYAKYPVDWVRIETFDMLDWALCREKGFTEEGAGMLSMRQKGRFCSLLRNEAGFRFSEILTYGWGTFSVCEKLSYVYQKAFKTGDITAFLPGNPTSVHLSSFTSAQNLGAAEFELLFVPHKSPYPYATLSYQCELGSGYQSHQGNVTIGIDF
jgi:hypothetical protein